jgi:cytochrome c-type biogenesis protein CcmH
MKTSKLLILFLAFFVSASVLAQQTPVQEPMIFENQDQEERFNQLTQELRCLVCQNQNLADSDATLAHDLRREVHEMLLTGKSNEQVKQFMVERYGDFVLYRPPVQTNTYLLWLAPLILRASIKKRTALMAQENSDTQ